jgi:hypothetical protein
MKKHCIRISLLFLLILCVASCREKSGAPDTTNTTYSIDSASVFSDKAVPIAVDTSVFAILPYDTAAVRFSYYKFKDCKPINLTEKDLQDIERILVEVVNMYNAAYEENYKKNKDSGFSGDGIGIDLKNYRRQYVPVINRSGEKEVWINGFCTHFDSDWHKDILIVFDGGKCFFQLYINLSTQTCSDFNTNGIG